MFPSDWLVNRRHCDSKWHIQSKAVRSRVAIAIKKLPQDNEDLAKILQDENGMLVWYVGEEVIGEDIL